MKIIFIGTVVFSELMLRKLIALHADIVGVLTKKESKVNSDFRDLSTLAKKSDIDYKYFERINEDESLNWIKSKKPDIIFCFGLSQIINKDILEIPPMGVVGYHPALLPKNRGRHPIIWAIVLGLRETGSTFFFMDEGADSGDILSQKTIQISEQMNSGHLYEKLIQISLDQVEEFLPKLQSKSYIKIAQHNSEANYWRKRSKKDGLIDFRMNASNISRLILGLSKPYVGADVVYKEHDIKIWEAKVENIEIKNTEPGKVLRSDNKKIVVKCGQDAIALIRHEFIQLPKVGEYL